MSGTTLKARLEEFKAGPCSPVALVPGIMGTKLVVTIDCETLKNFAGQRFLDCGWNSCYGIGFSPDKEYLLWISLTTLLIPITRPAQERRCFGDLMEMRLHYTRSKLDGLSNFPGINVTWYGNTVRSAAESKCGLAAVMNLNGEESVLGLQSSQCALDGYGTMAGQLQAMGYESGLTMQAIPYDYRVGVNAGNTTQQIPAALCNLFAITGKKAVLITHSLGSLHSLSALGLSMSEADRDLCVRHYLPIGPPWMGVTSAIRNALSGDPSYFTENKDNDYFSTGINQYQQVKFVRTSGGAIDLFLRDTFTLDAKEDWLAEAKNRIKWEKTGTKPPGKALEWFPPPEANCYDEQYSYRPGCRMGLHDFEKEFVFDIQGEKYYANPGNYSAMFARYSAQKELADPVPESEMIMDLFAVENEEGRSLATLPEPGVPVTVIFTSYYETQLVYEFEQDLSPFADNHTFAYPKSIKSTSGDTSVPSFSVLMPVSRWISLGNRGKSVKAVELCGQHGPFGKHYDSLPCQCVQNQFANQIVCSHACMISDPHVVEYAVRMLTNGGPGYSDDQPARALDLTENDLRDIKGNCLSLGAVDVRKKYATRAKRHLYRGR